MSEFDALITSIAKMQYRGIVEESCPIERAKFLLEQCAEKLKTIESGLPCGV